MLSSSVHIDIQIYIEHQFKILDWIPQFHIPFFWVIWENRLLSSDLSVCEKMTQIHDMINHMTWKTYKCEFIIVPQLYGAVVTRSCDVAAIIGVRTACQMIKSNLREEWMNSWALETKGRRMYSHMTKPNREDPINKLQREVQFIIFRLRTRHIPFNSHLKRINNNINIHIVSVKTQCFNIS